MELDTIKLNLEKAFDEQDKAFCEGTGRPSVRMDIADAVVAYWRNMLLQRVTDDLDRKTGAPGARH